MSDLGRVNTNGYRYSLMEDGTLVLNRYARAVADVVVPSLEKEETVLIYEKTAAGNYSFDLPPEYYDSKLRIEISGGAGSGGAGSATHSDYRNFVNAGKAGQLLTYNVPDTLMGGKLVISGIIGQGGRASQALAKVIVLMDYSLDGCIANPGAGGTGENAGTSGSKKIGRGQSLVDASVAVGGAGGGSSSLYIDGIIFMTAKGGNGGSASADEIGEYAGGVGGDGGTTSGTGAPGGAGAFGYKGSATSTAGTDGYIKIYATRYVRA